MEKPITPELRERIARVRNVILALVSQHLQVFDTRWAVLRRIPSALISPPLPPIFQPLLSLSFTPAHHAHCAHASIVYTYEDSEALPVRDLLRPDVALDITARARAVLRSAMES